MSVTLHLLKCQSLKERDHKISNFCILLLAKVLSICLLNRFDLVGLDVLEAIIIIKSFLLDFIISPEDKKHYKSCRSLK